MKAYGGVDNYSTHKVFSVFTSRCLTAVYKGGRSPSSGLPNCPRPQLPASHYNYNSQLTQQLKYQFSLYGTGTAGIRFTARENFLSSLPCPQCFRYQPNVLYNSTDRSVRLSIHPVSSINLITSGMLLLYLMG
jgi:hypothetical protein